MKIAKNVNRLGTEAVYSIFARTKKLEKEGKEFTLKDFFKKFNDAGSIPINLVRWEMTGIKSN